MTFSLPSPLSLLKLPNVVTVDDRYCFKFLKMGRRARRPWFAHFLLWLWPESVFLMLTKGKANSGDENGTLRPRDSADHSNGLPPSWFFTIRSSTSGVAVPSPQTYFVPFCNIWFRIYGNQKLILKFDVPVFLNGSCMFLSWEILTNLVTFLFSLIKYEVKEI